MSSVGFILSPVANLNTSQESERKKFVHVTKSIWRNERAVVSKGQSCSILDTVDLISDESWRDDF